MAKILSLLLVLLHSSCFFLKAQTVQEDSLRSVTLPEVLVDANKRAKNLTPEEREAYWRRIRDVKVTLPYAKYLAVVIIETYEYMQTLPEEEQKPHLRRVEKELRKEMEPKMRKLTLSQGKMLIKLTHRQTGSSGYELVKAVLGGWKAFWWNAFAKFLGANLKTTYDPKHVEDDAVTERIIELVEAGRL